MDRRKPLAQINITPLVDVLLILVAALMLLAPQMVKVLPADLPSLSIDGQPRQQNSLLVEIDERGRLSVDGHPLSIEDVQDRITKGKTTVEIAASGQVEYQQIVDVIANLRERQPRDFHLVMR